MKRSPTYLRVVLTHSCPMSCPFCHGEGIEDPNQRPKGDSADAASASIPRPGEGDARPLPHALGGRATLEDWTRMLNVALRSGIKKIKFLGGEPLVSPLLPALVAHVKAVAPATDVSIITSGAGKCSRLEAAFEAGLDRANLSIHGWTLEAFAGNGSRACYERRAECLDYLLELGRALKLNYVYTGPEVEGDLETLFRALETPRFTARGVVVSVLDELTQSGMSPDTIRRVLTRLCGRPAEVLVDEDPHSLPAERWRYASGLHVEIKSSQLSEFAPWTVCPTCPRRQVCREGTFALRLDPEGRLRYCMDRPDLGFSLLEACQTGVTAGLEAWRRQLEYLLEGGRPHDHITGPGGASWKWQDDAWAADRGQVGLGV